MFGTITYGTNAYGSINNNPTYYVITPSLYNLSLSSLGHNIIGRQVLYQPRRLPIYLFPESTSVIGLRELYQRKTLPVKLRSYKSSANEMYISLQLENAGPGFYPNDLIISNCYDYTEEGILYNKYDVKGIVLSSKMASDGINEIVDIKLTSGTIPPSNSEGIEFVRVGNLINTKRQGSILLASMDHEDKLAPFIAVMDGVVSLNNNDTYGYLAPKTFRFIAGRLDSFYFDETFGWLTSDGEPPAEDGSNINYGIYTDNGYFSGKICLGSATNLTTGTGLFADKDGNFRVGSPTSYLKWKTEQGYLEVKGKIIADSGTIGGFTIEGSVLWGGDVGN